MADQDGLSVTLKRSESERYKQDGSWLVAHGSPERIKNFFAEFFGFDAEGMTPVEVATRAERLWRAEDSAKVKPVATARPRVVVTEDAEGNTPAFTADSPAVNVVVNTLGGEVISEETVTWDDETPSAPPWQENDLPPADPVIAAIEKAGSKGEIQALFVQHTEDFKRPEVLAAAKKRTSEVEKSNG